MLRSKTAINDGERQVGQKTAAEHQAAIGEVKETAMLDAVKKRGFKPEQYPDSMALYRAVYEYWYLKKSPDRSN